MNLDQPPERPATEASPDIQRAIAKALQSAAALIGNDRVVDFFKGFVSDIVGKRFPIDAGFVVNHRCQDDAAAVIQKLLTTQ